MNELLNLTTLLLISPGRSGTKSLVDFCSRYTTMFCVHAPAPWVASIGYLYHLGKISSDAAKYGFYATREPYLIKAFEQGHVFFDGGCKNLPLTLEIADLLPNSRFIHLVRRPEDFIRSGLARGYYKSIPAELWGHLVESSDAVETATLEAQIEKIAYFWNEANRIAERAKERLGDQRVITLVAEEMFERPKLIIEALQRLGLSTVIAAGDRYHIRWLNAQKRSVDDSNAEQELIQQITERVCDTRFLYYR